MKSLLYVYLFSFTFSVQLFSQEFPFDFDNTQWKEIDNFSPYRQVYEISSQGDTIINEKQYTLLYSSYYCGFQSNTITLLNCQEGEPKLMCAIRQHNNQVFAIDFTYPFNYEEKKLFDYDLAEGDTMHINQSLFIKVAKITTLPNGRRVFDVFLSNFAYNDSAFTKWYEGVGTNTKILYYKQPPQWGLGCYETYDLNGNRLDLLDGDELDCPCQICENITSTKEQTQNDIDIEISPNPFDSEINIQTQNLSNIKQIEVYNTVGELIKRFDQSEYIDDGSFSIDELMPQLLFLKLHLSNKRIITRPIIKQ